MTRIPTDFQERSAPHELGRLAATFGRSADHCPFPRNTSEFRDWLNGWSDGQRERRRVEAGLAAGRLSEVEAELDYEQSIASAAS